MVKVLKYWNNSIQILKYWNTKAYVKPADRQIYLHSKSEHHNSTKKSTASSQALIFNIICYNRSDLHNKSKRLLNTLNKRSYNKRDTSTQTNRAISIPKNELPNNFKHLILNAYHLLLRITGLYMILKQ